MAFRGSKAAGALPPDSPVDHPETTWKQRTTIWTSLWSSSIVGIGTSVLQWCLKYVWQS